MNESIYTAIKAKEKQEKEDKQNKGKVVKVNKKMPDKWKKKRDPTINFSEIPIWQIRQDIYSTSCENNMIYIYNDCGHVVSL